MNPKTLKVTGFIWVDSIKGVIPGRATKIMKKHTGRRTTQLIRDRSFSLACDNRTLDLEACDRKKMETFIKSIQNVKFVMEKIIELGGVRARIVS